MTRRRSGEFQELAAYSVLILQVLLLLLRALLRASVTRCYKQALLLAGAWCCCCKSSYHQREGSHGRSYDAIFITAVTCLGRCCGAETPLLTWSLWRYEDYKMLSWFGWREFGRRAFSDFFISLGCTSWSRTKRTTKK